MSILNSTEDLLRVESYLQTLLCETGRLHESMDPQSILEAAEQSYRAGLTRRHAGDPDRARHHFEQAVSLNPKHAQAHGRLAGMLSAEGSIEKARYHASLAVELAPHDDELAVIMAAVLEADRQTKPAMEIVERLLRGGNQSSQLAILFAAVAPHLGREAEALDLISHALRGDPAKFARLEASLHFSAASLLDKLGRYDEAFEHAETANSLRGEKYDPSQVERPIREWIEYFTRPTLRRLPHATHGSELPVFIVGMPRSGTTLVEQILSSHPAIYGAGELQWLFRLCELVAVRHPSASGKLSGSFDRLSIADVDDLAEEYLRPLQELNPRAIRIINKMPTNFMHLGMIRLLFPMSKIIYCRRGALDTCLSCYMTDFGAGHDYSFALPSVAHYYRQHERMMAHWKSALDLSILDVHYEDVVQNLEGQARRMLQFLDIQWDDKCRRFYENTRFVATASNEQVRKPIYQTSVNRWRNYERHITPLKDALGLEDARL